MFLNYIKTAIRALIKNKMHSFINILGFSIGIVAFLTIAHYVLDEFSYDKFHSSYNRIYRWVHKDNGAAITPAPLADLLRDEVPEIESVVRLWPAERTTISTDAQSFYEEKLYFADPSFLDVFSFQLIEGDPNRVLSRQNTILVTPAMAKKYFPNQNPVGQQLIVRNEPYEITGIIQEAPQQSHFHFDFVASFKTLEKFGMCHWGNNMFYTYSLLSPNASPDDLPQKLGSLLTQHTSDYEADAFEIQPLKDIHLHSDRNSEIEANGSMTQIIIFSATAILVLLVACINYMNISIALASVRKKEIGIRKAVGAEKSQLIVQFFGESLFITLIAFVIGLLTLQAILPFINNLTGKTLTFSGLMNPLYLASYLGLIILITLIAGSYPALVLSSFKPQSILKDRSRSGKGKMKLQGFLVTFQFSILIALLICSHLISTQFKYMQKIDLGFQKENILILPLPQLNIDPDLLKYELNKSPDIIHSALSSDVPGTIKYGWGFSPIGNPEEGWCMNTYVVDSDFLDTYHIRITDGAPFTKYDVSETQGAFILNEAAVQRYEFASPVGSQIQCNGMTSHPTGIITGIAKNFHYQSLHESVEPCVLYLKSGSRFYQYLSMRVKSENMPATLKYIQNTYSRLMPNRPFEYYFLDSKLDQLYKADVQTRHIIDAFSLIALVIACMGFFGLASFIAERKTKEIGIRKVLGATTMQILFSLNKEFNKWILWANVIAWPVAWYVMFKWLQNFAYRVELSIWPFVLTSIFAILIALLTISWQAIRAATANPVEALKYE